MELKNQGKLDDLHFFADKNSGFILDYSLGYLMTANGGKDWAPFNMPPDYFYVSMEYQRINRFYLILNSKIPTDESSGIFIFSRNIGINWEWEEYNFHSPLKEFCMVDTISALILTENDSLFFTDNLGKSFSFVSQFDTFINDIKLNRDKLWAIGVSGTIMNSLDSGKNWTKIPIETQNNIIDIEFTEEGKIAVCGNNGLIAISNDDGLSWEIMKQGDIQFNGIDFFDDKLGMAIGGNSEDGTCFFTEDGGLTWQESQIPSAEYFDVEYRDADRAVCVGQRQGMDGNNFGFIADGKKVSGITNKAENKFTIYPNPADNYITLKMQSGLRPVAGQGEIYDLSGNMVSVHNLNRDNTIDVSGLAPGVYCLKFDSQIQFFIKQ